MSTPDILARLRALDKIPYNARPRPFLNRAPTHALWILTDGITPEAMARAYTPTFEWLASRGVRASDARSIFPTITGPAHTSMLTGARVGAHGFLYPKLLDAYRNRLLDFNEGLMRGETVAEAWRPNGLVTVGIGSRFMRGADVLVTEGVVGEDFYDITERAVQAVRDWAPNVLHVVYYVADSAGHAYGPAAPETLFAISQIDAMTARILDAYAARNMLDDLVVVINADHGMMQINEIVSPDLVEPMGAHAHGRLALSPRALTDAEFAARIEDPRIEDIYSRAELELLGAWGPQWGENVIQLKDGMMFTHSNQLVGYHGAWSRAEYQIPLMLSGAGIRAGAELGACEIIDLAPTLSMLLGGAIPEKAEGRVLWEALDVERAPDARAYLNALHERQRALDELKMLKHAAPRDGAARAQVLLRAREHLTRLVQERVRLNSWQPT